MANWEVPTQDGFLAAFRLLHDASRVKGTQVLRCFRTCWSLSSISLSSMVVACVVHSAVRIQLMRSRVDDP